MVAKATDAEIITASLEDPSAFGALFERHHESIYKYLARRVDRSAAGDLASDVFTTAFGLRHRYDASIPNGRPWLYGIARNLVRDHLRRSGRASAAYIRLAFESTPVARSPEAETEARLRVEELRRALSKLNHRDAEALLMYAVEGMEYGEIADVLGLKLGTVKSSINRARKKIGELVDIDRPTTEWGSNERGDST